MSAIASPPGDPLVSASPPDPASPPGRSAGEAFAVLADAEVLAGFRATELDRRRAEGLLVQGLLEVDRRKLHEADGYRCLAAWGRGVHRWCDAEARARRNLAHLAVTCPQVIERLLTGRLGVAQAHAIGRLFRAPRVGRFVPWFIDDILDAATTFDFVDFERFLKEWKLRVDPDGPDPARAHRERQSTLVFGDHEFHLAMNGPNIDGVKLQAILRHFEQIEFDRDWAACVAEWGTDARPELMARTAATRRYDAFINMLAHVQLPADTTDADLLEPDDASCSAAPGQSGSGDARTAAAATAARPSPTTERSPDGAVTTVVNVVTDLHSFLEGVARLFELPVARNLRSPFGPDRAFCHTLDGVAVAAHDAVLAAVYGKFRLVITDDHGRPIQITSTSRLFTGRMRDAILMTACHCTHPGCNRPATQCEIDHIVPVSEGGGTSLDNGCPACRHHNNWRYTTGARTRLRPDGSWATHRRNGTEIAPPI